MQCSAMEESNGELIAVNLCDASESDLAAAAAFTHQSPEIRHREVLRRGFIWRCWRLDWWSVNGLVQSTVVA